jgi:hypothetical protein
MSWIEIRLIPAQGSRGVARIYPEASQPRGVTLPSAMVSAEAAQARLNRPPLG